MLFEVLRVYAQAQLLGGEALTVKTGFSSGFALRRKPLGLYPESLLHPLNKPAMAGREQFWAVAGRSS
jgi:hypothetical protein